MRVRSAVTLILVAVLSVVSGCAYTLDTGNRNIDGGCHCLEKITAPIAKACAWTAGGALALVGAAAANSDDLCSDDLPHDSHSNQDSGNAGNGNSSPPQPDGKPLR